MTLIVNQFHLLLQMTDLHVLARDSAVGYQGKTFGPADRQYGGPGLLLVQDNAQCHLVGVHQWQ